MRLTLFVYFLGFGIFLPYFSPFLLAQGFRPEQVSQLLAAVMAAKIIAPPLLGWWIDHSNRLMPVLRTMSWLAVLLFALVIVLMVTSAPFIWWLGVLGLFGLVWQPLLSQLDVLTLRLVAGRSHVYSSLRAWGSIGFIVSAVGLGWLLDIAGAAHQSALMTGMLLAALFGLALLLVKMPEPATPPSSLQIESESTEDFWHQFRQPALLGFLLMQFLINVAHGVYYAFFSIYLAQHGYSTGVIGLLWALGVVAEIVLFFVLPTFLGRFSVVALLAIALGLMAVRWLMIGTLVDSLIWLLLAQILHAASFGLTHAVGVATIHQHFTGRAQARGQAVFSGFSYGGGAALGLLLAGWLWTQLGPQQAFAAMTLITVVAGALLWTCRALLAQVRIAEEPIVAGEVVG